MKVKTKTDLHFEIAHLRARLEVARLKEMHLLSEIIALKEQVRDLEQRQAITDYYDDRNNSGLAALAR